MNDDKITISMDDVNRATPVPGSTPPPFSAPSYSQPPEPSKPKRTGLWIGLGVAAAALVCLAGIGIAAALTREGPGSGPGENGHIPPVVQHVKKVAEFREETIREVDAEVSKPTSNLRKFIEDAHVTVDVTSAKVVRCDVTTVDGSDRAGNDDSNIGEVSLLIRFNWQGMIDTGYTDFRLVIDKVNDRVLKSEIEYTTALINTQDPKFWWNVGAVIGTLAL